MHEVSYFRNVLKSKVEEIRVEEMPRKGRITEQHIISPQLTSLSDSEEIG